MKYGVIGLCFFICQGCHHRSTTLFQRLTPEETGITFNNRIVESDSVNIVDFFYLYNGGGVAIGDVNNDGFPDIYFTGNQVSSKLYLNKGTRDSSAAATSVAATSVAAPIQFEDITQAAGVATSEWARGATMVDINNDGLLDIYVSVSGTNITKHKTNKLFINQGSQANGIPIFREQAGEYGLADTAHSTQAVFFDYDRDGDLDVYLLTNGMENFNHNTLRPKKKNGEGLSNDRLYRNDSPPALGVPGGVSHPVFTDVSREAGILIEGYGLGIGISDINRDGWPDVYCANDFITNDLLWINNHDGTFTDSASSYLRHTSYNGMGTDIADFNNDGLVDIVELDMLPEGNQRQKTMLPAANYDRYQNGLMMGYYPQFIRNTLQLNNGQIPNSHNQPNAPMFGEIGQLAGVYATDWSWSALFADYDNDGYRDLFITNGYPKDIIDLDYITYRSSQSMFGGQKIVQNKLRQLANELPLIKVHNYMYQNNGYRSGGELTFSDKSQEWGFDLPTDSNGAAFADLDRDGDLDLVINNINDAAGIYRNDARRADQQGQIQGNHYLRVQLKGSPGNKMGLGAKINLYYQGKRQFYEHTTVRGFESAVENIAHFGLGNHALVDSLSITWPDGKYQQLRRVKSDQVLTLNYQQATPPPATLPIKTTPLFREVAASYGIDYKHHENDFIDFKVQPLLPHQYSKNGPGLAVGDADGNGLEDFYVGGASESSGKIYYQTLSGDKHPVFRGVSLDTTVKVEEDLGALFFDADADGDLDLYVVSGGNEFAAGSPSYQDRLYRNEGKGKDGLPRFVKDGAALPPTTASGSCVSAADFDRDGDLDLFVGGRIVPSKYPLPAQSYLLRNNGGRFEDVTASVGQPLQTAGLVCASLWTDIDQDGWVDLVLSGEWMPIRFFKNQNGKLTEVTGETGLTHTRGWWNSLAAGDFDNDGDIDYVAGNLGLNNKYKASPEQPVQVFANDYDKNGSMDAVMFYYLLGEDGEKHPFPVMPRDAMTDQMVGLRKIFPKYAIYSQAQLNNFLPEKEFKEAYVATGEYFGSAYLENTGPGKNSVPQFRLRPLPAQAQLAPIFGMAATDDDGDGNLDLLTVGNSYSTEVHTGPYDASIGLVLKGDGKGNFQPLPPSQSGFVVDGDAKGIGQVSLGENGYLWLVTQNNGYLRAYENSAATPHSFIQLQATDAFAEVTQADGKKYRQEFYYGSTYLSQSSRVWALPPHATSASIHTYQGKVRSINLRDKALVSQRLSP